MNKGGWTLVVFAALILLANVVTLFSADDFVATVVADVTCIVLAGAAAIMAYKSYKNLPTNSPYERSATLLLVTTFIFRFFGEVIWTYHEVLESEVQYISSADIMWYVSYFLIIASLSINIKNMFIEHKARVVSIALLLATLFSGIILWYEVFSAGFAVTEDLSYHLILEAYVFADFYVIALLAIIMYPMLVEYNRLFLSTLLTAFGFISFAVFDFFYVRAVLAETYFGAQAIDFLYYAAYILAFAGFYNTYTILQEKKEVKHV